ncbi:MAG: GtrA family protein [Candidatus Parvarchaeota archaeon]|nr:GtrA family protein [Candidatus Parvarchaeota archaeon]MCW1301649.1 GtrA family protein [Candidatus Parvarchaeota archaeon]
MEESELAFVMPFFNRLKFKDRVRFLKALDKVAQPGTLAVVGNFENHAKLDLSNLRIVTFKHGSKIGDAFRSGFSVALGNNSKRIVTFEDYSIDNADWFLPYLGSSRNIVESRKRSITQTLATEFINLVSFKNIYNGFSMNRVLLRESAAFVVNESKRDSKEFAVEINEILDRHSIGTTEVIRKDVKSRTKLKPSEAISSVLRSVNTLTISYSFSSILSYVGGLFILYFSLGLGLFYPLAIFIGQESNAISNFIINEKLNFQRKGFLSSAYRLGKYNSIMAIPMAANIGLVWFLEKYIGFSRGLLPAVVLAVSISMSAMSIFIINKSIWSRGMNKKVKV